MLLKIIREGLGRVVVLVDQITRPTPMTRSPELQRDVDAAVQPMALYQYFACPFCIKTRRAIHRLNLPIALRDAQNDPEHRAALAADGGKIQVPCLRIDEPGGTRWLYESSDIIAYLEERFGADGPDGGRPDEPAQAPARSTDRGQNASQARRAHGPAFAADLAHPTTRSARPRATAAGWPSTVLCLGALGCAAAHAEPATLRAYECVENGVKNFSDKPCGRVERRVFLGYSSPKDVADQGPRLAAESQAEVRTDAFIDRLELKRAIARAEGRLSDLRKQRDAELARLRASINSGAVIHAIQPGQDSPTDFDPRQLVAAEMADHARIEEMRTISTRYAQDIAVAEQHLEQLQDDLATMETAADPP